LLRGAVGRADRLATIRALYLDSARVKVSGSGTINLADEALSLAYGRWRGSRIPASPFR
jgi:hypothetical protein